MPLTVHQRKVLAELAASEGARERYLAGGAALHFSPNSIRFSDDLDFFHDTVEQVDRAFRADCGILEAAGYQVEVGLNIPGFIRAVVGRDGGATRVDWARDSAWRFMPLVRDLWVAKSPSQCGNGLPRARETATGEWPAGSCARATGRRRARWPALRPARDDTLVWGTRWPGSGGPDVEKRLFL